MKKLILFAVAGVATATLFATIASCTAPQVITPANPTSARPTYSAPTSTYSAPTSTYSAPMPVPSDMTVDVQILSQACFGTAGCNVTYRIAPKTSVQCPTSCTVTYRVDGGEDPQIQSFTLVGGQATIRQTEMISTRSAKSKLTATVTSVLSD